MRKFTQTGFDDWCAHIKNLQLAHDKWLMYDTELRDWYTEGISAEEVSIMIRERDEWEAPSANQEQTK